MQWFYVKDGKQVGPVSQELFDEAKASGEINDSTLVWNETMSTWATLASLQPSGLKLKEAANTEPEAATSNVPNTPDTGNLGDAPSSEESSSNKPALSATELRGYSLATGGDFLLLTLKNVVFTMLTFGIYSFWAKVAFQRFWHESTHMLGTEFEYHATGLEKLKAFMKVALLGIVFFGGFGYLQSIVSPEVAVILQFTFIGVILIAGIFLRPFIEIGTRAFFLARTSWNGVHFSFRGRVLELVKIDCIGAILTILTLGIYTPWYLNKRTAFFTDRAFFGTEAFSYSGSGSAFAKVFYINIILSIITLGIYTPWAIAAFHRFKWDNTSIGGTFLQSDLTGSELLMYFIKAFILSALTLGIYNFWATVNLHSIMVSSVSFVEEPDMTRVRAMQDMGASAISEALAEMGEAAEALGEVFAG